MPPDPRAVAAEQHRNRTEMRKLAELAATAETHADRHRHLKKMWERAVLAAIADHKCGYGHTGCTGRSTRALYVVPPADGGAPYEPRNGRGACEPCYRRERARRRLHERRAAAAPPEPQARSLAGLMQDYGLR